MVDRLLAEPMSEALVQEVSGLGRRLIALGVDLDDADGLLHGHPTGRLGAWGHLPAGERAAARRCVGLARVTTEELNAVMGARLELARLLDGLGQRCGIKVAEEALAAEGLWRLRYRLVPPALRALAPVEICAYLGVRGRTRRAEWARWLAEGARARARNTAGPDDDWGLDIIWYAPLAEIVAAGRRVRQGEWVEVAWERPLLVVPGVAEKVWDGVVTFRLAPARVRAMRRADVLEAREARPWRARVVPGLGAGTRGLEFQFNPRVARRSSRARGAGWRWVWCVRYAVPVSDARASPTHSLWARADRAHAPRRVG